VKNITGQPDGNHRQIQQEPAGVNRRPAFTPRLGLQDVQGVVAVGRLGQRQSTRPTLEVVQRWRAVPRGHPDERHRPRAIRAKLGTAFHGPHV